MNMTNKNYIEVPNTPEDKEVMDILNTTPLMTRNATASVILNPNDSEKCTFPILEVEHDDLLMTPDSCSGNNGSFIRTFSFWEGAELENAVALAEIFGFFWGQNKLQIVRTIASCNTITYSADLELSETSLSETEFSIEEETFSMQAEEITELSVEDELSSTLLLVDTFSVDHVITLPQSRKRSSEPMIVLKRTSGALPPAMTTFKNRNYVSWPYQPLPSVPEERSYCPPSTIYLNSSMNKADYLDVMSMSTEYDISESAESSEKFVFSSLL